MIDTEKLGRPWREKPRTLYRSVRSVLPHFCTPISRLTLSSPHTRFHILPFSSIFQSHSRRRHHLSHSGHIADPMSLGRPKVDLPSSVLVSTHKVSSPIDHADMVARVLPQLLQWPATTPYSYMTPFKYPGRPSAFVLSVQPRCMHGVYIRSHMSNDTPPRSADFVKSRALS